MGLAAATLLFACGDTSTAPPSAGAEMVVVSVAGISSNAAGIVLRLGGDLEQVDAAEAALEVAWTADDAATTVAILGPVADVKSLLIVRRRAGLPPLRVEVIDVSDEHGTLSLPPTARAVATAGT
jgi:hypothetical protein